ncbi:hypothetical protein XELAEV_18006115mg [Xenopus laevis]|uniref:GIY-YIG domain-containing protein n=1 Tax=Xenopus laevis TaxID=8355 RepID=A0A974DYP4_XENLA|nr:hypothetical protein XELAEV_18006115mg [Xenopus laevis]
MTSGKCAYERTAIHHTAPLYLCQEPHQRARSTLCRDNVSDDSDIIDMRHRTVLKQHNRYETCKYILCTDQVAIPNTQKVYTILDLYLCASSNVVYIITCTRCSTGGIYIGETGQKLSTRMNHHRHKINTKSCDTPVGQHFCSQNHSLQDMQVLILKGNFKTVWERKIYEFKCMELFNTLRQGLNLGSGFMSHYVT